jgi:ABC-type lipoprotein export system ATPase subunit
MDLVQIANLKKSFRSPSGGTNHVIDIRQFQLAAGQQMALKGGSGTGKTTFLHLLSGILQADSGSIMVDGNSLTGLSEAERDVFRANNIGYIFQTFHLLPGFSAIENVALGMSFSGKKSSIRPAELLERVGMRDRLHYLPGQLSVGQQQRVAVARALVSSPKLILADEPTASLDTENRDKALQLIQQLCREENAALLLVTHDEMVLKNFTEVQDLKLLNGAAREESA